VASGEDGKSDGGVAARRARRVENVDEKTPDLSRLELASGDCFVGVAGNSNRGVPIRNLCVSGVESEAR
jgi:hypothetical protein